MSSPSNTVQPTLWLIRHGETEWSVLGRHTGRTDLPLTENGRTQAERLREALAGVRFSQVVTSPLLRARQTCELSGVEANGGAARLDADLMEWDYGEYDGLTSAQIRATRPDWFLWTEGVPGGESPAQVCARADRALARLASLRGDVAVFAHGHLLRVLALRYLGWPLELGAQLALDTATIGRLAVIGGRPSLGAWNAAALTGP